MNSPSKNTGYAGVGLLGPDYTIGQAAADATMSELQENFVGGFQTPEINMNDDMSQRDVASLRQSLGGASSSVQMLA